MHSDLKFEKKCYEKLHCLSLKAKICCNIFLFLNLCVHLNVVFSKIYAPVISVFLLCWRKGQWFQDSCAHGTDHWDGI